MEGDSGSYHARLSEDWEIWGPNGGYLAAIALRAAGDVAQIKQPASFYCHFLSSPAFDVVELKVSVLKQGRRAESFAVEMTQQGKPILHAMVKTAAEAPGYSHQHPSAPAVPLPETLRLMKSSSPQVPSSASGRTSSDGPSTRAPRMSHRRRWSRRGYASARQLASRTHSSMPRAP